jgi:hypothetical protein
MLQTSINSIPYPFNMLCTWMSGKTPKIKFWENYVFLTDDFQMLNRGWIAYITCFLLFSKESTRQNHAFYVFVNSFSINQRFLISSHRCTCTITTVNFSLFLDIKKYGPDLVCSVPETLKNIFEKILSQESMLWDSFSQAVLG